MKKKRVTSRELVIQYPAHTKDNRGGAFAMILKVEIAGIGVEF